MAKRTSFQDAEEQQKSLSELIEDQQEQESPEVDPQQEEPTPVEETSQGSEGGDPEVKEDTTPTPLSSFLREQGFDVDEAVEEDDLRNSLVERIRQQEALRREIEEERKQRETLAEELEKLRQASQEPATPPPAPAPEPPPQKTSSIWDPIEQPDMELLKMLERDPTTGLYRSREEYMGHGGQEAAERANDYARKIQQRSQELLRDPGSALLKSGFDSKLEELISKRAQEIVEEQIKGFGDFKDQALQAYDSRRVEEEKKLRIENFWKSHTNDFLKTGPDGNPVYGLDGNPVQTEMGREFGEAVRYFRDDVGISDEEKLLESAWRMVRHLKQEPVQQETQEAQPASGGGKELRRKFVERRESVSPEVPSNRDGYERSGRPSQRNRPLSLKEMALEDPETSKMLE